MTFSVGPFDNFVTWVNTTRLKYSQVQGEATLETLRRFRLFSALTVILNIVYMLEFWVYPNLPKNELSTQYLNAIGLIHAFMCGVMIVLGTLSSWVIKQKKPSMLVASILQLSICISYLVFGLRIAMTDQMVSHSVTSLVLVCVLVGVLSLMRPLFSFPLLLGTYVIGHYALSNVQPDLQALERIHGDIRLVIILAFVVSIIIWTQYVQSVLLRRDLLISHHALEQKQAELAFTATHDELTGLMNRREFLRQGEIEINRAGRTNNPISMIMIDVDFFKRLNDAYGHPEGDRALKYVATMLSSGVRASDIVARLGGEEFVVLLPNTSKNGALRVAEKMRQTLLHNTLQLGPDTITITASFGVSEIVPSDTGHLEPLYAAADRALYTAKHNGRNCIEFEQL